MCKHRYPTRSVFGQRASRLVEKRGSSKLRRLLTLYRPSKAQGATEISRQVSLYFSHLPEPCPCQRRSSATSSLPRTAPRRSCLRGSARIGILILPLPLARCSHSNITGHVVENLLPEDQGKRKPLRICTSLPRGSRWHGRTNCASRGRSPPQYAAFPSSSNFFTEVSLTPHSPGYHIG